ncbi:MAG: TetR/AcrR family transcriptional regulator [Raoultibacter sp.]|jgi:AcrR family transcriptional regulator
MARPRKDSPEAPAELRLEEAFWTLIQRFPLKEITVNMIVAEAKCARGSFYYHFTDINDLIDSAIDRNFPKEIPRIIFTYALTGQDETNEMLSDSRFMQKIDRICILAGPKSSVEVIERLKQTIRDAWLETLQLNENDLPEEAMILLEFVINGIIGVLAFRSRPDTNYSIAECLQVVVPDFPQAFLSRLTSILQVSPASESQLPPLLVERLQEELATKAT